MRDGFHSLPSNQLLTAFAQGAIRRYNDMRDRYIKLYTALLSLPLLLFSLALSPITLTLTLLYFPCPITIRLLLLLLLLFFPRQTALAFSLPIKSF